MELNWLPTLVLNGEHLPCVDNGADGVWVDLISAMGFIEKLFRGFEDYIKVGNNNHLNVSTTKQFLN